MTVDRARSVGATPSRAARIVGALGRVRWLRRVGLHPVVALPGYALVSALALVWGAVLSGFRVSRRGGVIVCAGMPRWAFGRGGTTLGAVYLTRDALSPSVLEHEAAHRAQWRRYGLAMIPLYLAAGRDPLRNRFEIAAGLKSGGYV